MDGIVCVYVCVCMCVYVIWTVQYKCGLLVCFNVSKHLGKVPMVSLSHSLSLCVCAYECMCTHAGKLFLWPAISLELIG